MPSQNYKNTPRWLATLCQEDTFRGEKLTLFLVFGTFPIKHGWRLFFEIRDRSHGGDLVETFLSTFLMAPIGTGRDPKMAGMLVGMVPG